MSTTISVNNRDSLSSRDEMRSRWLRFFVGLAALAVLVCFFASGYYPPGICGAVLRHNEADDIDASALFYSEVENMSELEEGVIRMREEPASELAAGQAPGPGEPSTAEP
jgi:hypothetical protein